MPIEVKTDGENLIFNDYSNREITIPQNEYLELMVSPARQAIRPALEDCLSNPTEVWLSVEEIEGETYSYYKYLKIYSNLAFIAYVIIDENMHFHLNNFFGFSEENFEDANNERCGQLILANE